MTVKSDTRRRLATLGKSTLAITSALVVTVGGAGFVAYESLMSSVTIEQIADSGESAEAGGAIGVSTDPGDRLPAPDRTDENTSSSDDDDYSISPGGENILVIGSDTRSGDSGKVGAGTSADVGEGARSDVNMLVHINEEKTSVKVISFPRDLDINRPDCIAWNNDAAEYDTDRTIPGEDHVKLNSAYAVGGPRCLSKVISTITSGSAQGLPVNRFLAVDFGGFIKAVDALGGVDVCVQKPMEDDELGLIFSAPGKHHVDGRKALDFARARKVVSESRSDYDRIVRQQYLIRQSVSKLIGSGAVTKPEKMADLVSVVSNSMYGQNLNSEDLISLARLTAKIGVKNIEFHTVPTTGTEGGNEVIDRSAMKKLVSDVVSLSPRSNGGVTSSPPVPESKKTSAPRAKPKGGISAPRQASPLICNS